MSSAMLRKSYSSIQSTKFTVDHDLFTRTTTASNATANATNPGVSPIDIAAASSISVTTANQPTISNSLGLNIEYVPNDLLYDIA